MSRSAFQNRQILLFVFILSTASQSFAQSIRFQKTYAPEAFKAGVKNKDASFYDVETLSDDGFATLGFLTDSLNRSEGFIARYDCTGKTLWTKVLGASGAPTNTNAGIVETDQGDLVFSFNLGTGFFRASILCGKIAKDGQIIWMKRIGNNTEFGRDIVKTPDGGFVIVGSTGFYGTDFQADDIYMLKLDANGNILWTKTFGNPAGTYDEAFAVKLDSKNNLIVTGRCIADTTFQAFILKTDPSGIPIQFKTYGYHNQRTNAFDILVDKEDNYLITGFTTILETDHTSAESDPYLIKVDSALNLIFANVYEVNVGRDFSTIGEGLCLLDDGGYAIGVSTSSFSNHDISGPSAPNKNALYVIRKDGSIRKAFLYNMHGSQYTRVRKSSMGSVLLGGFSRAYTDKNVSQGLIIKTDNFFFSGCNDIDVTPELTLYKPNWQIADFKYQTKSGNKVLDYINVKDSLIKDFVVCEEIPLLTPDFEGPQSICPGQARFIDQSGGPGIKYWIVDQDTIHKDGNLDYFFNTPGIHTVTLVLQFSCVIKTLSKTIEVLPAFQDTIKETICPGVTYNFKGNNYTSEGIYTVSLPGTNGQCDSIFVLDLKFLQRLQWSENHEFCGSEFKIYDKTFTQSNSNANVILKNQQGCDSLEIKLNVTKIFLDSIVDLDPKNQIDTLYFCDTIRIGSKLFTTAGSYTNEIVDTLNDCVLLKINVTLINNCFCLEFPNLFTPENGDDLNDEFKPYNHCGEIIEAFKLNVFNRWGQKVFESNDYKLGWDGRFKSVQAPPETYMYHAEYKIRFTDRTPIQKSQKGAVSLIR
ncbi:MAG: gliding motility-associated C-terminal domain-containing protein [Saprospiraceae bacterium]|nr:gliding motility-associated C-terminal domain-containing protein [Saprospiraceae bacterium]